VLKLEVRIKRQEFPLVDVRDRIEPGPNYVLRHCILPSISVIAHVTPSDLGHFRVRKNWLAPTDYGSGITLLPLIVLGPDEGIARLKACSSTDPPEILVAVNFLYVEVPELFGVKLGLTLL
jgi:hypothetical protein